MRGENGFTIIEALIAVAILSVGLVVLYGVGSDILSTSTHISGSDRAVLFACSKLETLALVPTPLPTQQSGQDEGFSWHVTAETATIDPGSSRTVLQNVQLVVTWRNGLNTRSLQVATRHLGRIAP